jgi:4-amino-4-deoxy-L-arabinose transferase-like glycosyltransferase
MNVVNRFFLDKKGRMDLFLLSLVFGLAFFQCLGRLPLLGPDEVRYMEIPREMLERGDFVTPTLNYVPYFEKPPLHYWLNAFATALFGGTAFAGRFFGALWGVLSVLLVYQLGSKISGRSNALLSALVIGTSLGYVAQCRVNITDTTLTIFLCAALGSFLIATRPDEPRKGLYFHLFYAFAALAVLAKGLIGIVLPGAIIFSFLAVTRRWSLLREMRLKTGIPLFLLVCAPWFVLVSLRNPGFLNFFFIHEHFERFLTNSHHRYQPPWFYLVVLAGSMLPWSFFIPSALLRSWRERKESEGEAQLFLLLWTAVILLFFSLSHSKLVPYILPAYPAIALLIGSYLADGIARLRGFTLHGYALCAFHLLCGIAIPAYTLLAKSPRITTAGAMVVGTLLIFQGVFSLINTHRGDARRFLYTIAAVSYLTAIVGPPVVLEGIAKRKATRDLALMVKEQAGREAVVACFGYHQELPLYTQRRVVVVGGEGELEFGSKQGDQSSWFMNVDQFLGVWAGPRQVFILVQKDTLALLSGALKPAPAVLGREGTCFLITNRGPGAAASSAALGAESRPAGKGGIL